MLKKKKTFHLGCLYYNWSIHYLLCLLSVYQFSLSAPSLKSLRIIRLIKLNFYQLHQYIQLKTSVLNDDELITFCFFSVFFHSQNFFCSDIYIFPWILFEKLLYKFIHIIVISFLILSNLKQYYKPYFQLLLVFFF